MKALLNGSFGSHSLYGVIVYILLMGGQAERLLFCWSVCKAFAERLTDYLFLIWVYKFPYPLRYAMGTI
ncbi:hypothetical protein D6B99_06940 [Arachidicoccus soli]|uniref:Uncharacterized protein n=2 Tax=Arachidicoccus soli TaxID=2341117 RepID=A0A386HN84_9BACT|nr:hypothetical protein D6B99_06940 [Arachidicoccus soli]